MFEVFVDSGLQTVKTLRKLKFINGVDYYSIKGAVAAGRPNQLILSFKDRNNAILFKLKVGL